jgi:hypothetical protein
MKIKVYAGVSLDKNSILKILPDAHISSPVKRGDLLNDLQNQYQVIAIIDGEYLKNLSVAPTEIMDTLRCGMKIYGGSGVGALRAKELKHFGMIGGGKIFNLIDESLYFSDDILGSTEVGDSRNSMLSYLDFEFLAQLQLDRKKSNAKIICKLVRQYQNRHFLERSLEEFQLSLMGSGANQQVLEILNKIKRDAKNNQKKKDAIALLKLLKNDIVQLRKAQKKFFSL